MAANEAAEASVQSEAKTADADIVEIPELPYTFNPPPHPSIMHVRPDLGEANPASIYNSVYDETGVSYPDKALFQNLRLGRIVMWEKIFSFAMKERKTRYGFRFLYNPTTVSGQVNVGQDFLPDPGMTISVMMQDGLETISFELMLNRMPEVQGGAQASDYPFVVSQDELDQLRLRGTHYDVEYLYRVANGIHNTQHREGTGDIGILLPQPSELYLGPYRTRGALISLSVTDQMFSHDMVPMLSTVQVTFGRYLAFSPTAEQLSILASTGVTVTGSASPNASVYQPTGPTAGNSGANQDEPVQGNATDAPIPGYNTVTTGWKYSSGKHHGAWDYGSGGVRGRDVLATRGGEVDKVAWLTTSFGHHVIIRTGDVWHIYGHLDQIKDYIKKGHVVQPGEVLGTVGTTGNSTGHHLHYEERVGSINAKSRQPQFAAHSNSLASIKGGAGP